MTKDVDHTQAFCERFNEALDTNGIPPRHQGRIQFVAEMFMLSHAGAGKWVNGLSLPAKRKRRDIAERLNVSYDWLEFGHGEMRAAQQSAVIGASALPVLSFHDVVNYHEHIRHYVGSTVTVDASVSDEAFVVHNHGPAMSGRFPEGTILVFDPQKKPQDGDYVLAVVKQLPEAIFRQLVVAETGKYLYAHDPRYKTHKIVRDDIIVAKMVQAKMNFD